MLHLPAISSIRQMCKGKIECMDQTRWRTGASEWYTRLTVNRYCGPEELMCPYISSCSGFGDSPGSIFFLTFHGQDLRDYLNSRQFSCCSTLSGAGTSSHVTPLRKKISRISDSPTQQEGRGDNLFISLSLRMAYLIVIHSLHPVSAVPCEIVATTWN